MARIVDGTFNERRRVEANTKFIENTLKFKNSNGNFTVVSTKELHEELFSYVESEMMKYPELKSDKVKKDIEERLTEKLENIEIKLLNHIDDKINKITQEIVSKTNKRYIDGEVNRLLNEKLEKLKNLL
jgi:RNA polymerase-binding transcription factor DksA